MDSIIFPNDDNAFLLIPKEPNNVYSDYNRRPYHESLFRWVIQLLIKKKIIDGNIIDLGAWIGDNAAPWAKIQNNLIYAIDPSDINCEYINRVKNLNNLDNLI